jgi:hypothetical protein
VQYRLADGSSQLTRSVISPGCPSAAAGRDRGWPGADHADGRGMGLATFGEV